MSNVGFLPHNSSRRRTVSQIGGVWWIGMAERLIAVLYLFVVTGGVVRLLLEEEGDDVVEHVGDVTLLMTRQMEVAETSAFGRLLSLPVYCAVALVVLVSWPRIWQELRTKKPTLALVILTFASFAWSVDPSSTVRHASGLTLCTAYGIYLAQRFGTEGLLRLLAFTFTAMAVLSLIFVAVMPSLAIMDGGAWRGIFTHKNTLGAEMSWGVMVCSVLAVSSQNHRFALALPIIAVPLFFSQSTTAILSALMVSTLIIGLWLCRRIQSLTPLLISGAACILGLLALTNLFSLSGDTMGEAVGKDTTLTGRTELWQAAWWWIQQNFWFGYGYKAFWTPEGFGLQLQRMIQWPAPNAHNGFLEIWLGLGAIGVAAVAVFLIRMAYEAVIAYRTQRGIEQMAGIGVVIMTLLVNSTESVLLWPGIEWIIAVASLTATRSFRERPEQRRPLEQENVRLADDPGNNDDVRGRIPILHFGRGRHFHRPAE